MTDSRLDFSSLDQVNHLWPAFVERLGSRSTAGRLSGSRPSGNEAIRTFGSLHRNLWRRPGQCRSGAEQTGLNAHGLLVILISTREQALQLLQQA